VDYSGELAIRDVHNCELTLPAPDGPKMADTSPAGNATETSSRILFFLFLTTPLPRRSHVSERCRT
jgi:hypothetical protein